MANTADLKLYLLKEDVELTVLSNVLINEKNYYKIITTQGIQQQNDVRFMFFLSNSFNKPDWYNLIEAYISVDRNKFMHDNNKLLFYNHNFIGIIEHSTNKYLICGGGAASTLYDLLEQSFGIQILERIFDPEVNKIEMINDKGLIGDILSSSRYYRRGRSLFYEEDFGKYFQKILVRLSKEQIKKRLPAYVEYRSKKIQNSIAVSGSNSLNINGKIDFITLIRTIKDISTILDEPPKQIFNTKLKPLSKRYFNEKINRLQNKLISMIVLNLFKKEKLDFDICSRDMEAFYSSTNYEIMIPSLSFNDRSLTNTLNSDNIDEIRSGAFINDIVDRVTKSNEYRKSSNKAVFSHKVIEGIYLETFNSQSLITTKGKLTDYLQAEVSYNNISYFLLDSVWYELKTKFDDDLESKYLNRVSKNFKNLEFIKEWPEGVDEDGYNILYNTKKNPIFLHKVLIKNIEICDILFVQKNVTYIIHVKDGVDVKVRDLTSQVFISSRIIEDEKRSKNKENLKQLYISAERNSRIDKEEISEDNFISYFTKNKIVYCLVLRPKGKTPDDIQNGRFKSRIAKFSLFELSTIMYGAHLNLNIVIR